MNFGLKILIITLGIVVLAPPLAKSQTEECSNLFFKTQIQIYSTGDFGEYKKLSTGESIAVATFFEELRVIKLATNGEIAWQKSVHFPSYLTSTDLPINLFITEDDEIYVSGLVGYFFKMNSDGDILWIKYKPVEIIHRNIIDGFGLLPNGDMIMWVDTETGDRKLVRMNSDLTKTLWIKDYRLNDLMNLRKLFVDGNDIILHGFFVNNSKRTYRFIRIDAQTGEVIKAIEFNQPDIGLNTGFKKSKFGYLHWNINSQAGGRYEYAITILDESLSIKKTFLINGLSSSGTFELTDDGEIIGCSENTFFKINPDLTTNFSFQNYINILITPLFSMLHNGRVTFMNARNFYYIGIDKYGCEINFNNLDLNGNLADCFQNREWDIQVSPFQLNITNPSIPLNPSNYWNVFRDTALTKFNPENIVYYSCRKKQVCDFVEINKPSNTICTHQPSVFAAIRNPECTAPVKWRMLEKDNYTFSSINDTAVSIVFTKAGKYRLIAETGTCLLSRDTLEVNVYGEALSNLGSDTTLCPGDSIQLNAGSGFSVYKWNTGATDSTIWIKSAGKYFVTVDNACGTSLSDTIEIFMPSVPSISAGNDSAVCMGEKFERIASPGFTSYQWKNISNQQIVSNNNLLSVTAVANTQFALMASTAIGCTRHDTLGLQVMAARPFDLGNNQSICAGDTVNFSAPNYYTTYNWNTGATSSSIQAWQVGKYSLAVTDTNGCRTSDSVSIVTVFVLPQPNLGTDKIICTGSSLLLNPGNFSRYQWQDGSTQTTFNASANGPYFVQVWDANNCTSHDTMRITAQLPLPASFLQATDSLCRYEKLTLMPNAVFKTYLWSTGSNQPAISVDKPGSYILRVTNNNDCAGADTIRIIQKTCMEGVYIPTAFTPGNNGLNDVFRPLVFGVVIRYEFSVYNRFGERMFVSNETGKGWDGTWLGKAMPANTYVWMCSYQLEGGEAKVEKGMVLLIR